MAFTRFATSEPWDPASGERLNKLGDELQEQINDCSPKNRPTFTSDRDNVGGGEISFEAPKSSYALIKNKVRMDIYDGRLRIFEDGANYEGVSINLKHGYGADAAESIIVTVAMLNNAIAINNLSQL